MRKNKTYAGQMTRHEKRKYSQIAALILFMLGAAVIGFAGERDAYKLSIQPVKHVAKPNLSQIKVIQLVTDNSHEAEIRETADQLCKVKKLGDYCAKDLVAIAWAESRLNPDTIPGDGGEAIGLMQIHLGYHPEVKPEQAKNLKWAMNWALDYLISHGYPKYRSLAIRSYNGSPTNPLTAKYLLAINNF